MSKSITNKRFIAAAVCPQCQQQDKVFTYLEDERQWQACASCDFKQSLDELLAQRTEELPTRVNQAKLGEQPLQHETAVEVLRLMDPK